MTAFNLHQPWIKQNLLICDTALGVRGQTQKTNTKSVILTAASDISCVLLRRNLNVKNNYTRLLSGSSVQLRREEIELFMRVLHQTGRDETLRPLKTLILRLNQITHAKLTPTQQQQPLIHVHEGSSDIYSCFRLHDDPVKHLHRITGNIYTD